MPGTPIKGIKKDNTEFEVEGNRMRMAKKLRPVTKEELPIIRQLEVDKITNEAIIRQLTKKVNELEQEKKKLSSELKDIS